jgi:hypothetical protein
VTLMGSVPFICPFASREWHSLLVSRLERETWANHKLSVDVQLFATSQIVAAPICYMNAHDAPSTFPSRRLRLGSFRSRRRAIQGPCWFTKVGANVTQHLPWIGLGMTAA